MTYKIRVEILPEFFKSGDNMAKKTTRRIKRNLRPGSIIIFLILMVMAVAAGGKLDFLEDLFLADSSEYSQTGKEKDSVVQNEAAAVEMPEVGSPLQVHFLDVGQGDSELIRIPTATGYFNILIDTGEYKHADGLLQYLQNQGIEKLDIVVATHPHADHIGSMAKVINNFAIGEFYMPVLDESQTPTTKSYETMLDALLDKNVSVNEISAGIYMDAPVGTVLEVLAPQKDFQYDDINNYSAVIRMAYGETSFLFTGDAEKESEQQILSAEQTVNAQVLKVGHHGSSSSTTHDFLQAVGPQYAVISCEEGNSYGHPHKETVKSLQDFGTEILRTDTMQTIVFESDGKNLTFRTGEPSAQ
ncbi:ComEC/Rec2 family competence protein [Scatolibacter rhodanostii]|uniref:ComEC/Rec2 family competence protein n=1 Tax=Scatolibacter rhodanostii TaxID=2014781 RepID=UPI000C06870C|nr:ComEC/Rec2 family competence protein [Scatolibacter rhodanostii]